MDDFVKEREGVRAEEAKDVVCFSLQADHKEGGDLGKVRLAYIHFGAMTEHIVQIASHSTTILCENTDVRK
jgi:hypothetical protein